MLHRKIVTSTIDKGTTGGAVLQTYNPTALGIILKRGGRIRSWLMTLKIIIFFLCFVIRRKQLSISSITATMYVYVTLKDYNYHVEPLA